MRKGKFNKLTVRALTGLLLVSSFLPYQVLASPSSQQVENVLKSLSPEQRKALTELQIGQPVISPDINLTNPALTNVIIEFKQAPAKVEVIKQAAVGIHISTATAQEDAEEDHEVFKKFIQKMNATTTPGGITPFSVGEEKLKITKEYHYAFNGVAMTLPGSEIEALLKSGVVNRVWKDNIVQIDPKEMEIAPVQNQSQMNDNRIPLEGIDELHNRGIKGKGIRVGVLDTGIDYNHPDLMAVYKGYKAQQGVNPASINPTTVKGWDFIDNDADPMETTYQDWIDAGKPEGATYYTSHGTHVSGTIAGQGTNNVASPALGVAPDVDLYVYRVLGPYGSGAESGILSGIEKSIADGMQVINLSLGATYNDPIAPESIAINNATLSGVTCLVAAGNSGPNAKTVTVPGTSALGITVGASDFSMAIPTVSASVYTTVYAQFPDMKLLAKNFTDNLEDLTGKTYPIEFAGLGYSSDFEGKDFTGKVALVQRGENALDEKVVNARAAGATAVLLFNNVDGEIPHYTGQGPKFIPAFRLSKADGEYLLALNSKPTITFGAVGLIETDGNKLADFSGRGPVNTNYDIKPDIVGPGVAVYSSYPEYINSPEPGTDYSSAYARISGTSMATPHMAGVAALILQQNPAYTPFDVKAALMNTAGDLNGSYSVYEVGAGLVDVVQAVNATTSIKVMDKTSHVIDDQIVEIDDPTGSIFFGSHSKSVRSAVEETRKLVFKNNSAQAKEYHTSIEFLPAKPGMPDGAANGVTVSIPSTVSLATYQSVDLTASIVVPSDAALGRYEGYIHIANANQANDNYQIPFAVRVVEPGIDYIQLSNQAIMTKPPTIMHPFLENPEKILSFKLNSAMQTVEVLITDKDGLVLGSATDQRFDAVSAPIDEEIYIPKLVGGWFYPLIGDSSNSTIHTTAVDLPEGEYKIRMNATDLNGQAFTKEQAFVVDNTLPELHFRDKAPGVYEVSDDMYTTEEINGKNYRALWVHANVHDAALESLSSSNITQSANHLYYYENQNIFPDGEFPIQSNGDVKFGVTPTDIEEHPLTMNLFPVDMATNARLIRDFNHYGFIKAGSDYVVPQYNKDKVYLGDEITMTLNLNNVQKLISGTYNVEFYKHFDFVDVKVNPAFKAIADQQGLVVTIDPAVVSEHEWNSFMGVVNVGASISGDHFHGFDGDSPFLDVTFKLNDDKWFGVIRDKMNIEKNIEEFVYMKDGETEPTIAPVFNQINGFNIIPKQSTVESITWAEAFLDEEGYLDSNKDLSKIGSKAYAKAADGTTYEGTIEKDGLVFIDNLPVTEQDYNIIIEIPGHLKSILSATLSTLDEGERIGINPRLIQEQPINYAGDVNGDGMIDILDVKQIANNYNLRSVDTYSTSDLNLDGIVNERDMQFVVKNFLKKDDDVDNKPLTNDNGKTLENFLSELIPSQGSGSGSGFIPTPSEKQGTVTIDPNKLTSGTNGKATVEVPTNTTEIKLPSNTTDLLKQNNLEVKTGDLTLEIPSNVLKQLTASLSSDELKNSSISLRLGAFKDEKAKELLDKNTSSLDVKLAGQVYEFALSVKSKDGTTMTTLSKFDEPITITFNVNASADTQNVAVYYISEDSTLVYIGGEYKNGEIVAQISHFSKYAVLEVTKTFSDVPNTHWASAVIKDLVVKQIISGTTDSTFNPEGNVTRAEFTKLLVQALKLTATGETSFTDVDAKAWYASYVAAAVKAGIVSGKSDTIFVPNAQITREEMVAMLMRAYAITNTETQTAPTAVEFSDASEIATWAIAYVKAAAKLQFIQGRAEGEFVPKGLTTRAEAAQVIYNLLKK